MTPATAALLAILLSVVLSTAVLAEDRLATSELNPGLVEIHDQLLSAEAADLVGRRLDLVLDLRHASSRHLLFTDTRVVVDEASRYYLVKWSFEPGDVEAIVGKSGVPCRVQGRVVEVVKGATSPGMPYVVVELESVSLSVD